MPTSNKYFKILDRSAKDDGRNKKTKSTRQNAVSARVKEGRLFIDDIIQKSPSTKLASFDGD